MDDDEKKELVSVINSGWFTEASKTKKFEVLGDTKWFKFKQNC